MTRKLVSVSYSDVDNLHLTFLGGAPYSYGAHLKKGSTKAEIARVLLELARMLERDSLREGHPNVI